MEKARMPMADFHQDTLNPFLVEILEKPELNHAVERSKQLPREGMKKLDIIFASIYRRMNDQEKEAALSGDNELIEGVREDELRLLDYYKNCESFNIITKPEDLKIRELKDPNNIILHKEGGDIITDPDVVNELYERGVRSIGPLYSHDNQLGGGASGNIKRGLTALGKKVINRMIELGMIIDLSHANRKTANDILEQAGSYNKTVATHTALGETQRTIDLPLMRKIAAKGGVIGFTPIKPFFPSMAAYVDNFKKASDVIGSANNIGIATDFGGVDAGHLFDDLDEVGKLSIVAERLSEAGQFTDEEIAKIMYGNVARIVQNLGDKK